MINLINLSRFAVICGIFALALNFSSCGKKGDDKTDKQLDVNNVASVDTTGAAIGDWVVIRELSDPEKMNPIVSTDASADEYESYIFETLLGQDKVTYD